MRIITRDEWDAKPAKRYSMPLPAPRVWLHHSAGADLPGLRDVNNIQAFHQAAKPKGKGWSDIAYSFLIDTEGNIFEGRGAGVIGAHTQYDNSKSHGICVIGNYDVDTPTTATIDALVWLLREGAEKKWWPEPKLTGGHKEAPHAATKCPGKNLYALIPSINLRAASESEHVHCSCIKSILDTIQNP